MLVGSVRLRENGEIPNLSVAETKGSDGESGDDDDTGDCTEVGVSTANSSRLLVFRHVVCVSILNLPTRA